MRYEKKIYKKTGAVVYSFLYWCPKTKKRIRLRRSEIPADITTDDQAREFVKIKEAELKAFSLKVKREILWKSQFYDFDNLLELYAKKRKTEAPNSWKTDVYYLEQYVFTFFLTIKRSNNLNNWDLHFEELRDWLENDAELLKTKSDRNRLAYATKNACIKSLNRFLDTMARSQRMKSPAPRCRVFPKHKINWKGIESYLYPEEIDFVFGALSEVDTECAEFFWVLCHTGLRLNEGVGLALSHIFKGEPKEKNISKMLKRFEIKSFLHVVLDSQPANTSEVRDKDGIVKRKPLKHRRKIEPRSNRLIPVSDKRTAEILVRRFNEQAKKFKVGDYGEDKGNYLLFSDMDKNRISNKLRKVYSHSSYSQKSPHDCRHTYCTNMVSQTEGHNFLAKYVLGHADSKTTENYLHLWELIQQKVLQEEQVQDSLDLDDVLNS